MNLRKEVELIIEQNITKKTRIDHFRWDPRATSTPARKPLNTLSNFEQLFGYNQSGVTSRNIGFKTTPVKLCEVQNFGDNSSNRVTKKSKTRSRRNSFCYDDDDEADDNEQNKDVPKTNEAMKNLIIKLGSDEFDNKRIKKSKSAVGSPVAEVSWKSKTKKQNETMKKKVICKSSNGKSKPKANNSMITVSVSSEERKPESRTSSDTSNSPISNVSCTKNCVTNEKDLFPKLPETLEDIGTGNTSRKRKIKVAAMNDIVCKKSRDVFKVKISALNKNNTDDPIQEAAYTENVNSFDKSIRQNKSKLSSSHEIFSENKERELMDSLDLTTNEHEESDEKPKSSDSGSVQVFQKKGKNLSRKKVSGSKIKLKYNSDSQNKMDSMNERPKRARKSPKEFWLVKSQDGEVSRDSNHKVIHTDKPKKVQASFASNIQQGETTSKKIMASSQNGSNNSYANNDFFKDIMELEFTEIPHERNEKEMYSYALGWKFPSFKCGALKIGKNCESSGRTKHENSHFGAILLQGRILMKIQDNEIELTSGQMFCVPPLADWKATNISRKDCILYYWCGRFPKH